jgi:lipoate-protein ligase A
LTATTWRLFDEVGAPRTAAEQMLTDLALLDRVEQGGAPALRLYTWSCPALSLGHFQPESDVDRAACTRYGVDVVRRPTGGAALLHGSDVTYAVAMPRVGGRAGSVASIYETLACALIEGLGRLGVAAEIAHHDGAAGAVCFSAHRGADLRAGGRKLCGSAQLRRSDAVLQHGSILLHRLPFDEIDLVNGEHDRDALRRTTVTLEELAVVREPRLVADALIAGFTAALGITFEHATPASESVRGR